MTSLRAASEAVEQALEHGRIGTCVSIRLVCHTLDDHGQINELLGAALEAVCRWLGQSPERLTARGAAEAGQITVLLRYAAGQSALVSVGTRGQLAPSFELVLVGSRGVLAWEPADEPFADTAADPLAVSETARRLVRAVEASLQSGLTVSARERAARKGSDHEPPQEPTGQAPESRLRPAVRRVVSTPPPYGVLLVAGAHTHQENYAPALAADPRCRIVGVTDEADVSPRRAALNEQLARTLGVPLLARLEDALDRDDVQIVSVCAEPARRGRIIVRCAQAGKHLYLDKPLAGSVEEADAAVRAVEAAGVVNQMFSLVHTEPARRARRAIESGALGGIVAIHCDLFFAKGPAGTADLGKPRVEAERPRTFELVESKRELFNVGVYPLALIQWLLGERVRRVSAVTANYFFREHQQNNMEDYATVLMELDGGVAATIAVGRTGWLSSPMGGVNRTYLIGTKGTMAIDAYRPRLAVWANEEPWQPPQRHPEDPMGMWSSTQQEVGTAAKQAWIVPGDAGNDDARAFLDCVQRGENAAVSAVEGAHIVEALLAAYRSAATGAVVGLPLPRG